VPGYEATIWLGLMGAEEHATGRALGLLVQGGRPSISDAVRPTIVFIKGGPLASIRLDDNLRPFTSPDELKVVHFTGN
jgi:hypothetical protein